MTNAKELQTNEEVKNQIAVIAQDTEEFAVVVEDGKYKRKAKYKDYTSINAESRADKLWLLALMENDEDTGNGLKDHVGKTIEVANVITRKYDKVDEETGELQYGVLTYLITPDREAYVTSAKSVYFTLQNIFKMFGYPHEEEWENIQLQVKSEKMQNGTAIKVKMVG